MLHTTRVVLLTAALAALPPVALAQATPLRVIRVTPDKEGGVSSKITVSFDRPVAGSLDQTVDPASIVHVETAIPGKLEWRDPVTIRLTPAQVLPAGQRYTVTVANSFHAMDGSALKEPYTFS